jgi:predicted patatin/cPLA2 family phospholipase
MNQEIKTALVVEGGGMRGIFAAGVLDCFFENGFDPFDSYVGVSAGACNLSSHLAGQYMRNYRCYMDYMSRPDFISLSKYLRGGHYMDLDWFWEYGRQVDPLDVDAASKKEFHIVTTDAETGAPIYFVARPDTLLDVLKGSSAIPLLYRNFVEVENHILMDGGISDPIPIEFAIQKGANRIMVLRSRAKNYIKNDFIESKIVPFFLNKNSELRRALFQRTSKYNESIAFIKSPPKGIDILEICPTIIRSDRTTQDKTILKCDYIEGKRVGRVAMKRWKNLISDFR